MTNNIAIIDYNSGNLKSVCNMLDSLGLKFIVTNRKSEILQADKIVFPGQGHFGQAMNNLRNYGLDVLIPDLINNDVKFLGICIGLQILFEQSEEAPEVPGLGVIKGKVKKFQNIKTPQVGWNRIITTKSNRYLSDDYFYFVNSYFVEPDDLSLVASYTDYGLKFVSSVQFKNTTAVQFHPEKSAEAGREFFKKWVV